MKTKLFIMFIAMFALVGNNGARAQSFHYDVNNDGVVDITDAVLLVNYILGKVSSADAVDLGLPSGTKWASRNMGALKPEEYGDYYSWGETKEKESYNWGTYIHCDGFKETCHDLGNDICGSSYDVANVKWGGNWCIPTSDDFKELLDNCTYKWTTLNGVRGGRFTSNINGNSIFLPAAGEHWFSKVRFDEEWGYYWSSTLYPYDDIFAFSLNFSSYGVHKDTYQRCYGYSVRPVFKK